MKQVTGIPDRWRWFVLTFVVLCVVGCGPQVVELEPITYTTLNRITVYEDIEGETRRGDLPKGVSIVVTGVTSKRCREPGQTWFRVDTELLGNGLFACVSIANVDR